MQSFQHRPTYRFAKMTDDFVTQAQPIIGPEKEDKKGDTVNRIKTNLAALSHAQKTLVALIGPYEAGREALVEPNLPKLAEAKTALTAAEEAAERVTRDHESKQRELQLQADRLSEQRSQLTQDKQLETATALAAKEADAIKLLDLRGEAKALEDKIEAACCGTCCFDCSCNKKDRQDLIALDQRIAALSKKAEDKIAHPDDDTKFTQARDKLTTDLDDLHQTMEKNTKQLPVNILAADATLTSARQKYATLSDPLKNRNLDYDLGVNTDIMLACLRVNEQFNRLFTLISESLANLPSEHESLRPQLTQLEALCIANKPNINRLFNFFWCSDSNDERGKDIYANYSELTPQERDELLKDHPAAATIDNLLPAIPGNRREGLVENIVKVHVTPEFVELVSAGLLENNVSRDKEVKIPSAPKPTPPLPTLKPPSVTVADHAAVFFHHLPSDAIHRPASLTTTPRGPQ